MGSAQRRIVRRRKRRRLVCGGTRDARICLRSSFGIDAFENLGGGAERYRAETDVKH